MGEFTLAFAVSTPVVIGFELALRYVLQTLPDAPGFRVFLALRGLCAAAAVLLVAAVAALGIVPVSYGVLVPLLVLKFTDSVLDICLAYLQALGRHRRAATAIWVNTSISVVAIIITLTAGAEAEWAVVGSALSSLGVLLWLAPVLINEASGPWLATRGEVSRVLRSGLALGVAQTLISLSAYIPVFFLAIAVDEAAVGLFAVCQYAVTFANLFYASASQTWISDLRQVFVHRGRQALMAQGRSVAVYLLSVGLVGGLCTVALLPTAVPLIFGDEFVITLGISVPFGLAVLMLGLEYTCSVLLIVLNRYASRATTATSGVAVAGAVGFATLSSASVLISGYIVLSGIVARCVVSGWTLRTTLRSLR